MEHAHAFLSTLAVVLCTAAVTTVIFQWLRQPVILGYLIAGMLVGPHVKVPLVADPAIVQTLSEVGVILLMFSLGLEFRLSELLKVGPAAAVIAVIECSLMIWLGFVAGQAFGWTHRESIYAGAIVAISSTTIIVKAFAEQQSRGDFVRIVFDILIVEDLIAILLITLLSTLSLDDSVSLTELGRMAGRLGTFVVVLVVIGMLVVPRMMRAVVRLDRAETTLVASIGLAFGMALVAQALGYSVALGAFLAGSLTGESGVEDRIEELVRPVRDLFAAMFFVSVGMLIEPALIAEHWLAVVVLLVLVVVGKVLGVSISTFLMGQSTQTSVQTGMSLAQIGEFSFIIAGVGLATHSTGKFLYPVAVAVSALTTLTTPWLIRAAPGVAQFVDRKLPRPLQTFAALYSSWWELLRTSRTADSGKSTRRLGWLAVDAAVVATIMIGASVEMEPLRQQLTARTNLGSFAAQCTVIVAATLLAAPFVLGIMRGARVIGFDLAQSALPRAKSGLDAADAPRKLFVVTLQLAIVIAVGAPLLAITLPFVPPLAGGLGLLAVLTLLAVAFWRQATDLQGHTRASAQVVAELISQQTARTGSAERESDDVRQLLQGLGAPEAIELAPSSPAVGRTLAELNLRGRTGATVLAVRRPAGENVLVPTGRERLLAGDVLAVAGSSEAIDRARSILSAQEKLGQPTSISADSRARESSADA